MAEVNRWTMFNQFVDEIAKTLTPIARDIWFVIFRHADQNGVAYVTRKRIANTLGITEVHVSRGIKQLKHAELVRLNESRYGYMLQYRQYPIGYPTVTNPLLPVTDRLLSDSNESVTIQYPIGYPPVTNPLLPSNESVTHYRTLLQNISTEHATEHICDHESEPAKQPIQKQTKIKGTSTRDWVAQAQATFLKDAFDAYPPVKHKGRVGDPEIQAAWDRAAKREGGYEALQSLVMKDLKRWDGKFAPKIIRYLDEAWYSNNGTISDTHLDDIDF